MISYALEHVSRYINSIRAQKFLMQFWAVYVCFIGIFRLAYINQLYPREKKIISISLKKHKKSTIKII